MKLLMVLTSHDQLGNTGRKTGFWLEEFAAPYFVFRDAGVELTLASPKGGQPPIDPKSDLPEEQTPAMTRFKQDKQAQKDLSQTVKLSDNTKRLVNTSLPPDAELGAGWDACIASLGRPAAQEGIKALMARLPQTGGCQNRLGSTWAKSRARSSHPIERSHR